MWRFDDLKTYLVTGGAGFIGSWVAEKLLNYGNVVVVDDLSSGCEENLISWPMPGNSPTPYTYNFWQRDLRNYQEVIRMIDKVNPDVLVHLAANAREGASFFQPVAVVSRNSLAYTNVLTACIQQGLEKVVLFSSMSVYGAQQAPFDESMPLAPVDVYGLQKSSMESLTRMMSGVYGFRYVIIRPHNVFGPRQALHDPYRNVIGIWMNRIMREEPIAIFGTGYQRRAFSYIENSLPCYIRAITTSDCDCTAINIGGLTNITILEAANMVQEMMGVKNWPIEYFDERPKEVKEAFCMHTRAIERLGYRENITLRQGLKTMADWAKVKGPQEWRNADPIEIESDLIPEVWRQ